MTIGQFDGKASPDVDLAPDPQVSRVHARVWFEAGEWRIRDVGTRGVGTTNGTRVGGEEVRGKPAPTRLDPWVEIEIGNSALMLVGPGWHRLRSGDTVIDLVTLPAVNVALVYCGVPIISRVAVRNLGSCRIPPAKLDIAVGSFAGPVQLDVPALEAGESEIWYRPQLPVDALALEDIAERRLARLNVRLDGRPLDGGAIESWILPHNEWSFDAGHRVTLAAFVLRGHPLVEQLVNSLRAEYPPGGTAEESLRTLYEYVLARWRLRWVPEPVNEGPAEGANGQKVRLPHMMLDATRQVGVGTCLDIALFLAACVEALGLQPLIAVLDCGTTRHAIVGCWETTELRLAAMLMTRGDVAGKTVWIEPTGCAAGPNGEARLSFEDARETATKRFEDCRPAFVVDVTAARLVGARSLPFTGSPAWSPAVGRVLRAAETCALRASARLSTEVLLIGLLSPGVELTRQVFAACNYDPERDHRRLLDHLRSSPEAALPTANYGRVLSDARELARRRGLAMTGEIELLTALLDTRSLELDKALERLRIDRQTVRNALRTTTSKLGRPQPPVVPGTEPSP